MKRYYKLLIFLSLVGFQLACFAIGNNAKTVIETPHEDLFGPISSCHFDIVSTNTTSGYQGIYNSSSVTPTSSTFLFSAIRLSLAQNIVRLKLSVSEVAFNRYLSYRLCQRYYTLLLCKLRI